MEQKIAPVYDNGNCLNNKWDDEKMRLVMNDVAKMEAEAYKARRCIYELQGRRVNPYQIIANMEYQECSDVTAACGKCDNKITPAYGTSRKNGDEKVKKICSNYLTATGIVNGNDPYLYGEKLKAYLIGGAKHDISVARAPATSPGGIPGQQEKITILSFWGVVFLGFH